MAWFDWQHNFVVGNILPFIKRGIRTVDWIYALTFPVKEKHTEIFTDFYVDRTEKSWWRSNTLSFEVMINQEFGLTYSEAGYTGSIYVDQPEEGIDLGFMWNESEIGTVPIGATAFMFNENEIIGATAGSYMFNEGEIEFDYDFTVFIPNSIVSSKQKIISIVNQVKPASSTYKLEFYT